MTVDTISPDEVTRRVCASDDSSDGIPTTSDERSDVALTPPPIAVVPVVELERTRAVPTLSLGEIFAVLWAMQGAAAAAGIDVEVDPMPAIAPVGVHLWCAEPVALVAWLARENMRGFARIRLDDVVGADKLEGARYVLASLAGALQLAPVISVGPRRFIHWAFRDDSGVR